MARVALASELGTALAYWLGMKQTNGKLFNENSGLLRLVHECPQFDVPSARCSRAYLRSLLRARVKALRDVLQATDLGEFPSPTECY